jgi:trimethylamine-N-oxide reductase (cytochrome c)
MRFDANDPERPPMSIYTPSWEGPHNEALFKDFPLQLVSPHPRYSHHTLYDGKDSIINDVTEHRLWVDGYFYWVARLNPKDAAQRNIKNGDLISLFNDRGKVICAAQVTERIPQGVVHSYSSSAVYDPIGEPGYSADRGGCVNQLTPRRMIATKTHSTACNSCLIQVEKWDGK